MDIPSLQREFLDDALPRIQQDARIAGVAVSGSLAHGHPDEYSDVDLVLAVEDDAFADVMEHRLELIASWTRLVVGFTGEHVGEPRLIITLVGPPLLHVDLKFVRLSDLGVRVDDPSVVWERDGRMSAAIAAAPASPPSLDLQWIEDRFWVWIHYTATKLGRGELYDAIAAIGFLREVVLGPLACHLAGVTPRGVRHLETIAPEAALALQATVTDYNSDHAAAALQTCVELYRRWRDATGLAVTRHDQAEHLSVDYLEDVVWRI